MNFCRNCMKSSWHGNIFRITGLCRFHDVRRNDFIVITVLSKAVISAPDQRNIYNHNTRHNWLFGEYVADKHYIPTCLHWLIYLATLWSPANQTPSILFIWSRYHLPNRRFPYRSIDYTGRSVIWLQSMNLVNLWHKKSVVQTFVLYPYVIIDSTSYRYFMRYTYCSVLLFFVLLWLHHHNFMMTSSNGNIFRVTGHLCGEFTGHLWIPRTKASDAELWCFLWSASE